MRPRQTTTLFLKRSHVRAPAGDQALRDKPLGLSFPVYKMGEISLSC